MLAKLFFRAKFDAAKMATVVYIDEVSSNMEERLSSCMENNKAKIEVTFYIHVVDTKYVYGLDTTEY